MGANLELWTYRLFKNQTIYFEEVFQKTMSTSTGTASKDPIMVAAGKKAALTRQTATYTYEAYVDGKPDTMVELAQSVRDFIIDLDPAMEESPKKFYIAYKISQNIVCMEIQRQRLLLYVKLDPTSAGPLPEFARDVREIGHCGTGDLELSLRNSDEVEAAKR